MRQQPLVALNTEFPRWTETLRDRSHILIRPIAWQDKDAGQRFIEESPPRTRCFRFFGEILMPSWYTQERWTDIKRQRESIFVAVAQDDSFERIVGVGRYGTDERGLRCECLIVVVDEWRDKGLGASLMRHLISVARAHGIRSMHAASPASDTDATDLAARLGFRTCADPCDPVWLVHELEM